jgi:aspartate carbamoyltransferase regulatory subunit
VVEKRVVETPKEIKGIVHCFNPKCITNAENVTTRFEVLSNKPIAMKCYYCEKITNENEMFFF